MGEGENDKQVLVTGSQGLGRAADFDGPGRTGVPLGGGRTVQLARGWEHRWHGDRALELWRSGSFQDTSAAGVAIDPGGFDGVQNAGRHRTGPAQSRTGASLARQSRPGAPEMKRHAGGSDRAGCRSEGVGVQLKGAGNGADRALLAWRSGSGGKFDNQLGLFFFLF